MKQLTGLLAIVFIVVLAGCTNIHFDNGEYDRLS